MCSHYFDRMTLLLFVGLCIRSNKSLFPENDLIRATSFGDTKKNCILVSMLIIMPTATGITTAVV